MKKLLLAVLLVLLVAAGAWATNVTNTIVIPGSISHSDLTLGITPDSQPAGNLRVVWTTGATSCVGADPATAGVHVQTGWQGQFGAGDWHYNGDNQSFLTNSGLPVYYRQFIVTNLPPQTQINLCPQFNGSNGGTDWGTTTMVTVTTLALPGIHPALPVVPTAAQIPNGGTPPDMTGACVWVVGTGSVTHCTNETIPSDTTLFGLLNAANDQQDAHKTVIQIPAGTTITYRNYFNNRARDVQGFPASSFTTNGLNLTNSWSEGQGITFGASYSTFPGPSNSGVDTCDGIASTRPYYVHSPTSTGFQITCDKPFSQGGQLLNLSGRRAGSGTLYIAPYPSTLNPVVVTTTTPNLLPPPGVRINPAYRSAMATVTYDNGPTQTTQNGVANVGSWALKLGGYDGGGGDGNDYFLANWWFSGLEIATPSYSTDAVNGASTCAAGLIINNPSSRDIVFDRDYIHGQAWPDCTVGVSGQNALYTSAGIGTAIINSYIDRADHESKMIDQCSSQWSASDNMFRVGMAWRFSFANNYYAWGGIGIHFDGGGPLTDSIGNQYPYRSEYNGGGRYFYIARNTFEMPRSHLRLSDGWQSTDPLWEGHGYVMRQPLEFKAGRNIKVDGNIFLRNAYYESIATITLTSVTKYGISDFEATNNLFTHVYGGIALVSTNAGSPATFPLNRARIANNIFDDVNGDTWVNHVNGLACHTSSAQGLVQRYGYILDKFGDGEDVTFEKNTVTNQGGINPGLLAADNSGSEGFVVRQNILNMSSENGFNGVSRDGGLANSSVCATAGNNAGSLFSCTFPNAIWQDNLLRATQGNASYLSSAWPVTTQLKSLYMPGTPQDDPGWFNASAADYRLKASSGFTSGALGNPGIGANVDEMERAQGLVKGASAVATGTTAANAYFVAPDAQACPVDVSSSDSNVVTNFTRFGDTGGSAGPRTVGLTGLAPHTQYYAKVQCAVQQPVLTFRTQ